MADPDIDVAPFQKSLARKVQKIEECIWSKDRSFSLRFSAGVHPSGRITKMRINTELEQSEENCVQSLLRLHRFSNTNITKIEKINVHLRRVVPRGKAPPKETTDYLSKMNMSGTYSNATANEQASFHFSTSGLNKGTFELKQYRAQSDGSKCTFDVSGTIRVIDEETILGTVHNEKIYCKMNIYVDKDTIRIDKDTSCPSITEINSQCMQTPSYSITFQKEK